MDLSVSLKNKPLPAPAVLPAAERSEPERSEGERSAAAGKTVAELRALPRPDPEVVARPRRRSFTAEYKLRILQETTPASPALLAPPPPRGLVPPICHLAARTRSLSTLEAHPASGLKSKSHPLDAEKPEAPPRE